MIQFLCSLALISSLCASPLGALSTLKPSQGGTGLSTATAGDVGKFLKVSDDDPFTFVLDTASGSGSAFPFTPVSYGNATSTTLGFLDGFLSTASSTIHANATTTGNHSFGSIRIPTLTSELLEVDANGLVGEATAGTDYEVPVTAGDGLTRTSNDFDCDTASGSVFGCLASADWTTFNNKQASDAMLTALAGLTSAQGDLLYFTGSDAVAVLNKDTNATRYLSNTGSSNNPAWAQVSLTNGVTGTLPYSNGGTGTSTLANWGDVLYWNGSTYQGKATSTLGITASAGGADTQVQFNDGGSLGGDAGLTYNKTDDRLTLVYASTTAITAPVIFGADINMTAGDSFNFYGQGFSIQGDTVRFGDGLVSTDYANFVFTAIDTSDKTFTFPNLSGVPALGSYTTGYTSGFIPFGSSGLLATTSGFTWDGTRLNTPYASTTAISGTNLNYTTGTIGTLTLTNDLTVANGGTGASTLTGLLQGNGTGAITGGATINNGNWSGTDLSVANGGTGLSTCTADRLITGNGTSAFVCEANLTFNGTTLTASGITSTGTVDFSGATLRAPYSATPTVSTNGDIGIDSTSNQFKYQSGSATRVLGNGNFYPSFSYSTSTSWTGTTTIPLGTSYVAETWNGVQCFTDTGTVNVSFYDGTNRMNLLNASTTVGTVTLNTNNTFTAAEKRYVDVGTPASSPTKISCTLSKSLTAD